MLRQDQADAPTPALDAFSDVLCDLKAPFCHVPQQTWATAGHGDRTRELPHQHLGCVTATSHAQLPILSCGFRGTSGMKYAVAESRSISDKVLHWDDEAPSPAEVFSLFPLQAAAATSPSPWRTQGASGPLKQEDKLIPKQASPGCYKP